MSNERRMLQGIGIVMAIMVLSTSLFGAVVEINRSADWAAATNITVGTNDHGGVADPGGTMWSYHRQWTTDPAIDPGAWDDVDNTSPTMYYRVSSAGYAIGELAVLQNYLFVNRRSATVSWTDIDSSTLMSVYHHDTSAVDWSSCNITGTLSWETDVASSALVTIAKVDTSNNVTVLFQETVTSTGAVAEEIAGFTSAAALQNVSLSNGDRLVFGIRKDNVVSRAGYWALIDDGVILTPEPMTLGLLAVGGLFVLRRKR